ncbi:hypothetical protein FS749_005636 [Ceratobasidium sp. UAMH 11750]|nr:hypothetical protein FS749_005636 [Ceratobasidium sp. UAMH 11750]
MPADVIFTPLADIVLFSTAVSAPFVAFFPAPVAAGLILIPGLFSQSPSPESTRSSSVADYMRLMQGVVLSFSHSPRRGGLSATSVTTGASLVYSSAVVMAVRCVVVLTRRRNGRPIRFCAHTPSWCPFTVPLCWFAVLVAVRYAVVMPARYAVVMPVWYLDVRGHWLGLVLGLRYVVLRLPLCENSIVDLLKPPSTGCELFVRMCQTWDSA